MNARLAMLATRYAGRPVLMTTSAALSLATRIHAVDEHAFERPGRLEALFRRITGRGASGARIDAAATPEAATDMASLDRLAYAPFYLGVPEDRGFCWSLNQGVALMWVDGPISANGGWYCGEFFHGYDTILAGMQEAMADPRVNAVFLKISSPGGVVAGGLPELADFMRANREAAGGKPIWVYGDVVGSAAYYFAASGDRILAPAVGLVGSIGAVVVHFNEQGALAKAGIGAEAIQFGAKKTDGAWWKALSDTAREDLQAEIDQCGRDFVAAVCAGRPQLTPEGVIATEAGVFMAAHDDPTRSGLALGLVDAIMGEQAAFDALVAHVGAKISTGLTATPAAPSGPTAASPKARRQKTEKTPMTANQAALAAARIALTNAAAEVKRIKATAETSETPVAETPAPDGDDDDAEYDDDGNPIPKPEATEAPAAEAVSPAQAIAASAEAKTHPHLAMAAIQSGQTLAQFQANVEAAAAAPQGGRLAGQLAGSKRLGADAVDTKPAAAAAIDGRAIYARREAKRGAKTAH